MAIARLQAGVNSKLLDAAVSVISDPLIQLCLDRLSNDEQRGLLPQTDVRFGDWGSHFQYRPAGIVSGDYCDLIPPANEDGKLFFLLGDVAGKGVAAALLMTHLHATFRSLAGIGLELDTLLEIVNHLFSRAQSRGNTPRSSVDGPPKRARSKSPARAISPLFFCRRTA